MPSSPVAPYDALLLVSFGGPEGPADVLPFLENVTRGRGIPPARLAEVGEHYFAFGGKSPINDQCRAFRAAVEADLAAHDIGIPVYWGNRNWYPYLNDTLATMAADGVGRAAAFVTSAYASYSGCRQYRENLYDAVAELPRAPRIDRLRHYFNHPGFVAAVADSTAVAVAGLPVESQQAARLVFVTHSIPFSMASRSGRTGGAYVAQHRSAAASVTERVCDRLGLALGWDLVYCSRSGPPAVPWLEPDINDHLVALHAGGTAAVVVVPIGFVSDHMEVVYDLDTEAAATAKNLGMAMRRAPTAGVHPAFVASVRDLLLERAAVESGRAADRATVGDLEPAWDVCTTACCPNPRGPRPALCETPAEVAG